MAARRSEITGLYRLVELIGREAHRRPGPRELRDRLAGRHVDGDERGLHHLVGLTRVARLRLRQEDLARVRGQKLVVRVAHQRDMLGQASASTLNERRLQKLSAPG
eukprot:CAMPEP_0202744688 /NCGR_PEP_ID=MMETSP1388-20130828/6784_1 /ASSEMBLY_ACC=CAM_ASM_000864 /TAXON_ID=37098 /ORGANISM="Isochrysis sp, Strain CCMP1244" /LENGTH=105 /DNA_ID=CAMNT_0049411801 /DNA_START=393 /DNA_END=707 /DNA_ORIENTATION=+